MSVFFFFQNDPKLQIHNKFEPFFQYQKHLFVHIGGPTTYADPILEVSGQSNKFCNEICR